MADPLTFEQRLLRSRRAHELLTDDLMREAFKATDAAIVSEWRDEIDPARRDVLWCSLQGVHRVAGYLRQFVDDGFVAAREAKLRGNQ